MPNLPTIVARTIVSITVATHMAGIVGNLRRWEMLMGNTAFKG
jgi:hypothetical protein